MPFEKKLIIAISQSNHNFMTSSGVIGVVSAMLPKKLKLQLLQMLRMLHTGDYFSICVGVGSDVYCVLDVLADSLLTVSFKQHNLRNQVSYELS